MKTNNGMNVFDAVLQGYGDLELLFDLIQDNELTVNSALNADLDLIIDETKGKIDVKEYISVNNLKINNRTYSNDIQVEETQAIQWPIFVDPDEIIYPFKLIVP